LNFLRRRKAEHHVLVADRPLQTSSRRSADRKLSDRGDVITIQVLYLAYAVSVVADSAKKQSWIPKKYRGVAYFLRDAGVAALVVALILLAMFAFTGKWPPLVVVESDSMMHGNDNISHIGTIDTGDLVLVKKVSSTSDIETYVDGYLSGHRSYGDYGDVIIYKVSGQSTRTPIIHRTMVYLEANADQTSYRVTALKDLPAAKWSVTNPDDTWDHLTSTLTLHDVGYAGLSVVIDIPHLAFPFTSGYITKGDHNSQVDQFIGASPVHLDWVVGKARGEIPWFGLLKLWSTHTLGSPAPSNSVRDLYISIALIVLCPILIDLGATIREKRNARAKKIAAEEIEQELSDESEENEETGGEERP
jgi:signal peptidase